MYICIHVTRGLKTGHLLLPRYCARSRNRWDGFSILQFFNSAVVCELYDTISTGYPILMPLGSFDAENSSLLPHKIALLQKLKYRYSWLGKDKCRLIKIRLLNWEILTLQPRQIWLGYVKWFVCLSWDGGTNIHINTLLYIIRYVDLFI